MAILGVIAHGHGGDYALRHEVAPGTLAEDQQQQGGDGGEYILAGNCSDRCILPCRFRGCKFQHDCDHDTCRSRPLPPLLDHMLASEVCFKIDRRNSWLVEEVP